MSRTEPERNRRRKDHELRDHQGWRRDLLQGLGPEGRQPIRFHPGWPLSADDRDAQMQFFLVQGAASSLTTGAAIDVPVLVMRGDDDQVMPYQAAAIMQDRLLQNSQLKIYQGFSHGMHRANADAINADLLAFFRSCPLARRDRPGAPSLTGRTMMTETETDTAAMAALLERQRHAFLAKGRPARRNAATGYRGCVRRCWRIAQTWPARSARISPTARGTRPASWNWS